jgi:glycosyltransferase involved in cell wall biosynthesis
MDELPRLLARVDVGLVPSLPEPYLQLSLSTKLLEYAAMGVPIIASDLRTFREHFTGEALTYVPGGDANALAEAILSIERDPKAAQSRAVEASRQGAAYAWSSQRRVYLAVIERLIAGRRTR